MKTRFLISAALLPVVALGIAGEQAIGQSRTLHDALTSRAGNSFLADPAPTMSKTLFKGCEEDTRPPQLTSKSETRQRIEAARGDIAKPKPRVFAGYDEAKPTSTPAAESEDHCWFRLDGLWVERGGQPVFNTKFPTAGWGEGADTPELRALTHGVYTSPDYLIVQPIDVPERGLFVLRPFASPTWTRFAPMDRRPYREAMLSGGLAKSYRTSESSRGYGRDLNIRVARDGSVILETGGRQFVRPKAALPASQRAEQTPVGDAFNREATIQFLDVVSKGIDVTTQNPNRLANSNKASVFAQPGPTDYFTKDRKIVPIDMVLDLRSDQGSVYISSLMSTASEIQSAYASSYGYSVEVGLSGSTGPSQETQVSLEASAGFGASFAESQFQQLKRSNSVSQALGFSRQKQFALIRDHAQSDLDSFFRDAVERAVETGNYDRIIDIFGTHYPYATTFGSSGQVRHTTTREGFERVVGNNSESNYRGGGKLLIIEANYNESSSQQSSSSFQRSTEFGTAFFDAVGGNGSWNESGFSAGQSAYPILMDMRLLSDLLNPLHFPGQPEVYIDGRRALADAIEEYLIEAGRRIDQDSLRPVIDTRQRWTIRALSLNCFGAGRLEGDLDRIQLAGAMVLSVKYPTTQNRTVFKVTNPAGYRGLFCDGRNYTATDATKFVLEGTARELSQAKYSIRTNFDEVDFGSPIRAFRTYQQAGLAQALRPDKIFQGASKWFYLPQENELDANGRVVRVYGVPGGAAGEQPDLRLRIEIQREK